MKAFAVAPQVATSDESRIMASSQGYNLAAQGYDTWAWQSFWRANEFPIVLDTLIQASPKRGMLDVGVGTGMFLFDVVSKFSANLPMAGVDISLAMLKLAQIRLGSRATLLRADVQKGLPFNSASFDAVVMMRVANHLSKLDKAIFEVGRAMSPGGIFIATDLAEGFDYVCTRIPTPKATISIETYKHDQARWKRALRMAGFDTPIIRVFDYEKLRDPFAGNLGHKFEYKGGPIFQIIEAIKLGT